VVPQALTRVGVDVGGTFTDVVAASPRGVAVDKIRSVRGGLPATLWERLERHGDGRDAELVHGTTVATNALLERAGGRVVLVTTAGFEDLLWLRRQDRPALYDLSRDHPPPVVERADVIGVRERIGADGPVTALTDDEVRRVTAAVPPHRPDAVAVALLFAFRDPSHEVRLAMALRAALPDVPVVASHEVLPVFREYERFGTVAAEAYLRPIVQGYLRRLGEEASRHGIASLRVMASNGGTLSVRQASERAASLALSGPAGGVAGARLAGDAVGLGDLLTVDMGGTSADAGVVVDGAPLTQAAGSIGGIPLALPHVLIETVGAGGGSVAWVDRGGALRVGPRSAGASPGPACYGQGGEEATVTDAALVLGWLDPGRPLADNLALDPSLAERAVARVAREAGLAVDRCAAGIVEVAAAAMVRALRRVSVERGIDPRHMTLVPFGGAGPLFGCRLADSLGMRRLLVPPYAGVLSALGLAAAPAKLEFAASLHRPAAELDAGALDAAFAEMEREAERELSGARFERFADCRYPGQGYELTVTAGRGGDDLVASFHTAHRERYGHADERRGVDVTSLRLVASGAGPAVGLGARGAEHGSEEGTFESLAPGRAVRGPAVIPGRDATVRIEDGWRGVVHPSGALVVERS
jgi:N-methylhydantoinase A